MSLKIDQKPASRKGSFKLSKAHKIRCKGTLFFANMQEGMHFFQKLGAQHTH